MDGWAGQGETRGRSCTYDHVNALPAVVHVLLVFATAVCYVQYLVHVT